MLVEKYKNLIKACGDDIDLVKFVGGCMSKYLDYVNSVVLEAIKVPIIREEFKWDSSRLQYEITRLDKARRLSHEAAIDSCNKLNRISVNFGLPPFYEGDAKDRYQVADFAIDVVRAFYAENHSRNKTLSNQEFIDAQKSEIPAKSINLDEEVR